MSQSAARTLQLLEQVARSTAPAGLIELAEQSGLDKTTCARLLGLLEDKGWLLRDRTTKKYEVGPTLVGISMSAGLPDPLRLHLFPLLHNQREATGETVSLQRRFGSLRVCVAGLESREPLRRGLPVGDALPLTAGPSGKVILAFTGDGTVADLTRDLDQTTRARLRKDLDTVRATGYLSLDGDRTPDVGAIAVPLFTYGSVYGSVTVAGPSSRFSHRNRLTALPSLFIAARTFTVALGGDGTRYDGWIAALDASTVAPAPKRRTSV